jgi:tripartite-type tricarboxylate transporter receptor subunit TctC
MQGNGIACKLVVGLLAPLTVSLGLHAETFPSRPVTLVVPFAPGGSNDIVARQLGAELTKIWNQPVVVENKPGAGATVGSAYAAKQAPDGYTLLIASVTFTMSPAVRKVPYDPRNDFSRVGLIGETPLALGAKPQVPAKNAKEYFAYLKGLSGGTYGSTGVGSIQHFAGEILNQSLGTKLRVAQYKGGAPAMKDVMGGHIEFSIGSLTQMLPQFRAGTIKGIAVTSAERSAAAPELPTMVESGLGDFVLNQWWGILGPKGMDPGRIKEINAAIRKAVTSPEMTKAMAVDGGKPHPMDVDEFSKFMAVNFDRWEKLAQETGMAKK